MDISRDVAEQSLTDVKDVMARTQKGLLRGPGIIMMVWGVIWVVGFLTCHFSPRYAGWTWLVLDAIGFAVSILAGRSKTPVKISSELNWRIFFFWLSLFIFGFVWILLAGGMKSQQFGAFIVTLIMFAYVVMGLFYWGKLFVWLGLIVTALTLVGYFYLASWFWIWMAIAGGGGLFVPGIYLWFQGKRSCG